MKKIYLLTIVLLTSNFMHSQCNVNNPSNNSTTTYNGEGKVFGYAQSFKATCSGNMENFSLVTTNTGTSPASTLKIFNGNTVSGTPIYTQSYGAITITTAGDSLVYSITGNVPLILNNTYTFYFELQNINIEFNEGFYTDGNLWQDGDSYPIHDFIFSVSIIDSSLSVDNINENEKVKLFPNPSSDIIQISGLSEDMNYKIFNVLGTQVRNGVFTNNDQIDIRNFANGLYYLKFENGNTIKFIKE